VGPPGPFLLQARNFISISVISVQQFKFSNLPPFPDAAPGLAFARRGGHFLAAFSNGEEEAVRGVLQNADLLLLLDDVVRADEVKTIKPDPTVYAHAVERLGQTADVTWLVSSNPFDIIGAKTAGLRTAWIKRDPNGVFDPWGVEPDLVLSGLDQLGAVAQFNALAHYSAPTSLRRQSASEWSLIFTRGRRDQTLTVVPR
jgi:FMN phosphatase YigB (HAD superfamily)